MDVILKKDVEHVGLRGEVVNVARGFARNYLLPRNLAETATPAKVAELQKREAQRVRHKARTVEQAQEQARALEQVELRFDVKAGPTGSLFGSVTPTDIADELWAKAKIRVDRRKIGTDSIKRIGRYDIPIDLFTDVTASVKTIVVPEGGELPSEEELAAMEAAERPPEPEAPAAEETVDVDALVAELDAAETQEPEGAAEIEAQVDDAEAETAPGSEPA